MGDDYSGLRGDCRSEKSPANLRTSAETIYGNASCHEVRGRLYYERDSVRGATIPHCSDQPKIGFSRKNGEAVFREHCEWFPILGSTFYFFLVRGLITLVGKPTRASSSEGS
jgi:hypothetical protein